MQHAAPVSPDGWWIWNGTQWVPNPALQPGPGPIARRYEPATLRAMLATVFLGANVVSVLLLSAFDVVDANYLSDPDPSDTSAAFDGTLALLSVVSYYCTLIPAIVFFAMWVHRVVRNMPALGSPDPRWTPSGAVWRCLLPIFNLLHPLVSVLDAWRGSWSGRCWVDVATRKSLRTPALFAGWWVSWLAAGVLSRVTFAMQGSSDVSVQVMGDYIDVLDNALFVLAVALAILVVRDVTSRQESKSILIASGQLV